MQRFTALVLILILSIMCINCSKEESSTQDNKPEFSDSDVRNRDLKEAIENYNNGYYKASGTSIVSARGRRLRKEDIEVMDNIVKRINERTAEAIINLESLITNQNPNKYDFEYRAIHSNYDVSSYRQKINELNAKYLARIKKENDTYLENYYSYIEELKEKTNLTAEYNSKVFSSKTSPLSLKITIDDFETPQLYLQFKPSQKEPELETFEFSNGNTTISFDKTDYVINEYNLSASKIITFDLINPDSKINLTNFKELLAEDKIRIDLKWFYEPERITVSNRTISKLKNVLNSAEKLIEEYNIIKDSIYVPKNVK